MTWWFHLLIRRVDAMHSRCELFERVACAVGSTPHVKQVLPLLINCGFTHISREDDDDDFIGAVVYYTSPHSVTPDYLRTPHNIDGKPAGLTADGFKAWFSRGEFIRKLIAVPAVLSPVPAYNSP